MLNKDPISTRYAGALFDLAKREGRLDETARELTHLGECIQQHKELQQFLLNPDVEVENKLGVLDRLPAGAWSKDVRGFVHVVLSMGRAEYLIEMAQAFQELVDADHGLLRVAVHTVHPLSDSLKTKLRQRLAKLEQRRIEMVEETDPALLGGIQVFLGHRVFDGSVRTKLAELRQRLKAVRVH